MIQINTTDIFINWLKKLKDPIGKAGIAIRIKRAESGNFGDHKILPNTGGIYEMRIFKGNGYRVYYAQQGENIYLLLIGGSKDSQTRDVQKAIDIWQQVQQDLEQDNDDDC
ncbi:type II toxin-antitoxin system RelE/ParE family toxin [Psychrobacter sp. I-STPA6b]|uniref:type II toxin-antitoxin system RelE/ParE family toxin n=1 Tax=Psychrobacter sp. I-STPA6b TaxID=2585718 RepID=UPI001D0C5F32|nr:type II toxin-antitoxin system RelE/ParE family toxin [Psychrobacter sp. I-STPA6b]